LTIDNTAFQQSVQALDVHSLPQGGTAIAEAINTALATFKEKDHYKALVLLTDGEDNDEGALAAAQKAAQAGMKIFTIGIGTANGDLIRVTDENGNSDYVRDQNGNVVKSHLNEPLLQQIAGATGGFYLPLRGAEAIDTLYERGLAPMPKSSSQEKTVRRYHEQFQWPLAAAILLLLAEMFLSERKRAKKIVSQISKSGAVKAAVLTMVLCVSPHWVSASPATALHDYQAGNYTNALQEYSRLAEIHTNDLRLVFNAGTAAYGATNYDEAFKDFTAVTAAPDLKLQQQAYYNLGNTEYRMGELKFAPNSEGLDAMEETWKQALQSYSRSAQLNTNDLNATYNFSFVKKQIDLIAELRAVMRRAKMEADDAVRNAQFHQALTIMEQLTKNKIAAKEFEDYTKKLKDIDAITTPHQS
jgi:Ca-activated chloride channel family protein